jgi:hypothetical protein
MSTPYHYTNPDIEKTMTNEDLILNTTSQNYAIKVGRRRFCKKHS